MAAAAAVLVVALAGAALGLIAARSDGGQREAAMIAADGAPVGDVYVHDGSPAWMLVSVPAWTDRWGGQPYVVRITAVDGTITEVPGGDLRAGAGAWGTNLPIPAADVRTVALLSGDGRLWCTGTLT